MRPRRTATLRTPSAEIEYLVTRSGRPVTLYLHGLTGTIEETRTYASGVPGSAAFMHQRGHGATRATDGRWDLSALAGDARAVADQLGATQALGVSLGATVLLRLLADAPARFARAVLLLPPAAAGDDGYDPRRADWTRLARQLRAGEQDAVAETLLAMQPASVRALPQAEPHCARVAQRLIEWDGPFVEALVALSSGNARLDPQVLGAVTTPLLVVGQRGDPLHPYEAAAGLAAALPCARLLDLGQAAVPWYGRERLRAAVGDFLGTQ